MTHRPHMPLSVKLQAAILQLGLDPARVDFDHNPALGLREFNAETKTYTPDANDPKFITVLERGEDHRIKTSGTAATSAGSDVHRIAKSKRVAKDHAIHEEVVAAKATGERVLKREKPGKRQWPQGRKLQSRGFQERRT
ncbi:MAG: hypothetical protein JWR80_10017 [Bradyrhizobium sp.]|nr:hypothetical protein [Bradyrhizobium sp.]